MKWRDNTGEINLSIWGSFSNVTFMYNSTYRVTGFQGNGVNGLYAFPSTIRVEAIKDDGTIPDDEVSLKYFQEAVKLPDKTDIEFVAYEQCSYRSIWLHCIKSNTKIKRNVKQKNQITNQSEKIFGLNNSTNKQQPRYLTYK